MSRVMSFCGPKKQVLRVLRALVETHGPKATLADLCRIIIKNKANMSA